MTDLVHSSNGLGAVIGCESDWGAVWLHKLRCGVSSLASKDNQVKKGVGSQAVGPVDACAGGLPGGEEAIDGAYLPYRSAWGGVFIRWGVGYAFHGFCLDRKSVV